MSNLDEALKYSQRGWRTFPVHYVLKSGQCSCGQKDCPDTGKHPAIKSWPSEATTDRAKLNAWWHRKPYYNIGLATGWDGLIVMDIDIGPEKQGDLSLQSTIERNAPLPQTLQCRSGGGGLHYYFQTTEPIQSVQGRIGKHIDQKSTGGYVLLPPSNHKSGGHYAWIDSTAPIAELPAWLALLMKEKINVADDVATIKEVAEDVKQEREKGKISKADLVKLLKFISSEERDDWLKVGMALKYEFGDQKGFALWDEWSSTSAKYDSRQQQYHWSTFDPEHQTNPVTGGTILFIAKEKFGFKSFDAAAADTPEIKDRWIYVVGIKRFVETQRVIELDNAQFDSQFAPLFNKGRGSEHVLRNPEFKRVYGATYWPQQPLLVTERDVEKLNYWRPNDVEPMPGDIATFTDHIAYLLPKPEEAKILIDYLAFQVKYPGEKVHWAILLSGKQGTGKSYLAMVMQMVLGAHNVHILNNEVLHEPFTAWQRNTQFIVVEEIMAGNRRETMNKLKPMITENWCSIREMYKPPYDQPNRFNFLFLTNHTDAIIIDNTDRRYCVLASESEPQSIQYYAHLFDWTRRNASALLYHFMNHTLDTFAPKAHAPLTQGKIELIKESLMPLDYMIYERVQSSEWPFDADLSNPNHIVEYLPQFGLKGTVKDIAKAYRKLGFAELGRLRVVLNGNDNNENNKINIWAVRNFDQYLSMDHEQLRKVFSVQYGKQQQDQILNSRGMDEAENLRRKRPVNPLTASEPII